MVDKHLVRFEPVGIEIEVPETSTVLDAAFDQGLMLMHGCKEGQCAACKSFVLAGEDIELDKYSTFALPDYEREEGFTLLCRAHVYEDVTIELLNYDEEMIRSGHPIQKVAAEVVSNESVTHDMRHLVLQLNDPKHLPFFPGQYVDITVPGSGIVRSFSMANISSLESGQLEFVIKIYPGGKFSELLDTGVHIGDRIDIVGPYGLFTLRDGRDCDLVFVGGGAGMAPILSVLRALADRGSTRKAAFYYGARGKRDLCFEVDLYALQQAWPNFTYIPALSDAGQADDWQGEVGLITDVVRRHEQDLSDVDSYVCGPPPMVEAAVDLLTSLGAAEKRIYFDKFTTTGSS